MLSVETVHDKLVPEAVVPEAERVEAVGATVSAAPEPVIVKLALFTSKKMWLLPFTMIRLVVPGIFGITTLCEPSFGVPANKTVGNVCPPLVDNKMSTLAQFTPLALVPATVQLIVCVVPAAYETAVFCVSTVKGPAVPATVTTISSALLDPPPKWLSRTVKRKFKVLATPGSTSTGIAEPLVVVDPVKIVLILGKYLVAEVVAGYDLKRGPDVAVALGLEVEAFPKSISSQLYVNASVVLASVAAPININGVPFGIVKSAPALTTGTALPVEVITGQLVVLIISMTCSMLMA
ncbi:hypothetical protein FLJC2902T_21100 [Flavobacterium limnosediminis JC2902]|uniref:Uncharacterized protein n=1 Tax=Flavobacterium limnosediminis JC2902 TaxID=1341181 RepID=V6SSI9_9FLAO|nr:hypothetical protein FLJC2902T_21100 [Flavobacterium limnosediminis JC2902]